MMRTVIVMSALVLTMGVVAGGCRDSNTARATPPGDSAASELRALAEGGDAAAQFKLGAAYNSGDGVPQDRVQAVAWYRKAAEQGHPTAQYSLGSMYASGRGVQKDLGQAAAWYGKSAEQGRAAAQFVIAGMYERGEGVTKDVVEALKWATVAADRAASDNKAKYAGSRDALAGKMAPGDVAEAQKRAREWAEAFERSQKQKRTR
jgi:uncharacterized protein